MGLYKNRKFAQFCLIAFVPNYQVIQLGDMICLLEESDFENYFMVRRKG